MTHTSSQTVQKFLAAAARKRKFTLVHAEAFPNDHLASHATIVNGGRKSDSENPSGDDDERWKPLTAMGITVILIEHHLDVIRQADWLIDLGPGAGFEGGTVVFEGPPQGLADEVRSVTGRYV